MGTHFGTMTTGASSSLTQITTIDTSFGPEHFEVLKGLSRSKITVDPELAAALEGHYEAWPNARSVVFSHLNVPVAELIPGELVRRAAGRLLPTYWWSLLCCLNDKGRGLRSLLPTGVQLGCMVDMPHEPRVIRCKLDWEAGHHISLRSEPDQPWNPGTFFAVSRQY